MAENRKEAQKASANMTCRAARDEPVSGEAATLYNAHKQTPDSKEDSQIWISKSRGAPLELETDRDDRRRRRQEPPGHAV